MRLWLNVERFESFLATGVSSDASLALSVNLQNIDTLSTVWEYSEPLDIHKGTTDAFTSLAARWRFLGFAEGCVHVCLFHGCSTHRSWKGVGPTAILHRLVETPSKTQIPCWRADTAPSKQFRRFAFTRVVHCLDSTQTSVTIDYRRKLGRMLVSNKYFELRKC